MRRADVDDPGERQNCRHDHRPEDRRTKEPNPLAAFPADQRRHHHQGQLVQRDIDCPRADGIGEADAIDMAEEERRDRHDDQHPRRMYQGERAGIAPGLGAEDHHILQPARHRRVIGGGRVKSPKLAKERHADKADQRDKDRNQSNR